MRIVIDPGHGGKDPGATGHSLHEADYNLVIGCMLGSQLRELGHEVLITRVFDNFLELNDRVKKSQAFKADLFVSIHANAAEVDTAQGLEVHYYRQDSEKLAQAVFLALTTAFPDKKRRGVKQSNFYVIKQSLAPAILVECGFVTNPKEEGFLKDEAAQIKMATTIAMAINKGGKK